MSEPIIVITDHKNNTFNGLKASYRALLTSWLLLLDEYGVTFEYLPGKKQKMLQLLRMLYPVSIFISLRFKKKQKKC
jgi:hypothetical protein